MKIILSYICYFMGDLISRTIMLWGDGHGYRVYSALMMWSMHLDKQAKIWKHVQHHKQVNK